MKEYRTINGERFTVKRIDIYKLAKMRSFCIINYCDDIHKAYDRPSSKKVGIWQEWREWLKSADGVYNMRITGYNCNYFTIGALYDNVEGEHGYIKITYANNWLYLPKED